MARKTFSELGLLGLYTETSLHCGTESGAGYVDLPIQRERHTGYPVIPGSTIKGILRDELSGAGGLSPEQVVALFGTVDASGPGTVSFGDAIVVAFPVRSSGAPFHWTTCPFVLERVIRALGGAVRKIDPPSPGRAWAAAARPILLEELRVEAEFLPDFAAIVEDLLQVVPPADRGFDHTRKLFCDHLVIVRDEDFKELVEIGTEVVTRIKLNYLGTTQNLKAEEHPDVEQKEDLQGNMFVEELVPPETLFLAPLRALDGPKELTQALARLAVIRLGGDETIGRGLTHLTYLPFAARS